MAERVRDSRGAVFEPFRPPVRVVSLVPSLTELLCDLGLVPGEELVGRTRYCVRPPGRVEAIPTVGGTKTVDCAVLLRLAPDLVIANRDENQREIVEGIEAAPDGCGVFVTDPHSFDEALGLIRDLGRLTGRKAAGERLASRIADRRRELPGQPRGSALYLIWTGPYMTASPGTFVHDMLQLAGYANVIAPGTVRYPEVTVKEIAARRPDHILLASEPYPFREQHVTRLRAQLAQHDPEYAAQVNIRRVDGQYFSWYGSRLLEALSVFRRERFIE